ncbi:MAG: cold shock domain-containing protein [Oscillospiraceae bacterium]|nr:cold shock domain-containing protein [Oscillospiraceae bacterium]
MKGRVKHYNEQKKFGFILGEDGLDRFFHISGLKSIEQPSLGALVEFVP